MKLRSGRQVHYQEVTRAKRGKKYTICDQLRAPIELPDNVVPSYLFEDDNDSLEIVVYRFEAEKMQAIEETLAEVGLEKTDMEMSFFFYCNAFYYKKEMGIEPMKTWIRKHCIRYVK